jgi:hypothetical protein
VVVVVVVSVVESGCIPVNFACTNIAVISPLTAWLITTAVVVMVVELYKKSACLARHRVMPDSAAHSLS